jgi:uncharacterized protein (DUF697 family)
MHDLDRTTAEFEAGLEELEAGDSEFELDGEIMELTEEVDQESPFTEAEEMDLATEVLSVTNEAELDQFLGGLIKRVGRGVGKFVRGPVGRALGGALKRVGKVALPIAGKAVGGFFGGPAGAAIGGKLGSLATRLFEVDLEGMNYEDQEFEVARRFVRLAGAAAQNAASAPPTQNPQAAARNAVAAAARRHAPGMFRRGSAVFPAGGRRTGRWMRRGRKIILMDV